MGSQFFWGAAIRLLVLSYLVWGLNFLRGRHNISVLVQFRPLVWARTAVLAGRVQLALDEFGSAQGCLVTQELEAPGSAVNVPRPCKPVVPRETCWLAWRTCDCIPCMVIFFFGWGVMR